MKRSARPRRSVSAAEKAARQEILRGDDAAFDPGSRLCGHAPRHERAHYLGGGLWVCFECFAKLLVGRRPVPPVRGEAP